MSYALMNKKTGRFVCGTRSNKAVGDVQGLVDIEFAQTYPVLGGAKMGLRSWLDLHNSLSAHFRDQAWLEENRHRYHEDRIAESLATYVPPEDMVIVKVELVLAEIVE